MVWWQIYRDCPGKVNIIFGPGRDSPYYTQKKDIRVQKISQRSSLLFGGTEFVRFLAVLAILHQDDMKKRMIAPECYEKRMHCIRMI